MAPSLFDNLFRWNKDTVNVQIAVLSFSLPLLDAAMDKFPLGILEVLAELPPLEIALVIIVLCCIYK